MIRSVKLLKRSVIVNSTEVSQFQNTINLHRLTCFIKFNIDRVIPKQCGMTKSITRSLNIVGILIEKVSIMNEFCQHFSTIYIYKIIGGSCDTCPPKRRAYQKN